MSNNLSERIREWDEEAERCARQADDQTDPTVKQQFLELKRLWLLLARSYDFTERLGYDEANRKSDNFPSPMGHLPTP
jgi:hypothetical protein